MAKFVIAGKCNCPYYAKVEILADQLSANLPHFQTHKISKPESEWNDWLRETCSTNGWEHLQSPIIWRELVDRGGKGLLIGGCNDFLEYAECYYGVSSSMMTDLMLKIKDENTKTFKELKEEDEYFESLIKPIHICITNASSPVAYHLIPFIASGEIFRRDVEVSIRLFDSKENQKILEGVKMETEDLAMPLVRNITMTSDPAVAFKDVTAIFFLDDVSMETAEGRMESQSDWLKQNVKVFENYAKVLNDLDLEDTKIIVAGNGPVNMNAHVLIENTSKISKQNIVAASRLLERRCRALLSKKLSINSANVKDTLVWGDCGFNRSDNTFVDTTQGRCQEYDGAITGPAWYSRSLEEMVHDDKWLKGEFIEMYNNRDRTLTEQLKHATSSSAAASLASLMRDWVQGSSDENELYSLGVESEGWYGISNCVFSLPVKFANGSYQVIWDIALKDDVKARLLQIEKQIKNDWLTVFPESQQNEMKFTEDSELITSMVQQSASPPKITGEKLEIIKEEAEKVEDSVPKEGMEPTEDKTEEPKLVEDQDEKKEEDS